MAVRSVAENDEGANVGEAVSAGDADGDALMYLLSGDGAELFDVDNTGQITTAAELDYEALPEDAKYHMVTLMAQDPSGAYDSIMVQINVTDADDGATTWPDNAPAFDDDDGRVHGLREHGCGHGCRHGHGTDEDGDTLTYSDDSDYFDVDDMGNITTAMMLDYEAMTSHTVTVTATDVDPASTRQHRR